MGNVIQIKRGEGPPPANDTLAKFELGFDWKNNELYIGSGSDSDRKNVKLVYKTLPINKGGTGRDERMVTNRICWSSDSTDGGVDGDYAARINASHHYIDRYRILVNETDVTSAPTRGLLVNGDLKVVSTGTYSNTVHLLSKGDLYLQQTNAERTLLLQATGALQLISSKNILLNSSETVFIQSSGGIVLQDGSSGRFTIDGRTIKLGISEGSNTTGGLYLIDHIGNSYPAIYDNGKNLWIGAPKTAANHHRGKTYISAGYDDGKDNGGENDTYGGNATIYVSVPNYNNDGADNYEVYHAGHKPPNDRVKQTLSVTNEWRPLICHHNSVASYSGDPGTDTEGSVHYVPGISVQPSTKTLAVGGPIAASGQIRSESYLESKNTVECGALVLHTSGETNFAYTGYGTGAPATSLSDHKKGRVYFQVVS